MTNGSHRTAMPLLLDWCDEASVVHWDADEAGLPTWTEADRRMRVEGGASKVRAPSAGHAALNFAPPRTAASGSLTPRPADHGR